MSTPSLTCELTPGARLLTDGGYLVVESVDRHTVTTRNSLGEVITIAHGELRATTVENGEVLATLQALEPWWSGLAPGARHEALLRLEAVLEIVTGYRWGSPRVAHRGEPFPPSKRGRDVDDLSTVESDEGFDWDAPLPDYREGVDGGRSGVA